VNAREWLAGDAARPDLVVLGAPIARASITPVESWSTPPAFRVALQRFPTWDAGAHIDLTELRVRDLGDVEGDREEVDARAAHERIRLATESSADAVDHVVVIGGDNSLTRPAMIGMMSARAGAWALLTIDAHHDCRPSTDGSRNGTPVRELIEAGLPGERVAQIGIHPLGNTREHAEWARAQGIHIVPLHTVVRDGMDAVVASSIAQLTARGAEHIYVDFDIDVVDRAFAPACPASLPGGMQPGDLLRAAYLLGADPHVVAADLCEVDANADLNAMTVRLMTATFLKFCSGLATRAHNRREV
jgi:formiminoglutamase